MSDLLSPARELAFTLSDFKKVEGSGAFMSILTNINKLLAY
jgi:hypothetical protein